MDKEILELKQILENDSQMLQILNDDIRCLGHFICRGYYAWLFCYKGKYVSLLDDGNGNYSFDKQMDDIESGKYCILIEIDHDDTFSYKDEEFGCTEIIPCEFYFDDWDNAVKAIKRSYHSFVNSLQCNEDNSKTRDVIQSHERVLKDLCDKGKSFMMELEVGTNYILYSILDVTKILLENGSYTMIQYADEKYYKIYEN